ncbi:MAG: TetR/AcrR family transcriptional regulator [Polyangiaceae bacterium]
MARPREFDEAHVLDRALELFWSKGYEATSIQDLVDVTGLGRASLYGAFGDKDAIFQRVLEHYMAQVPTVAEEIDSTLPFKEGLEKMLRARISSTCSRSGPRGCFLQIAGTARDDTPGAREMLLASLAHAEKYFEKAITLAQARREIDPKRDPASMARLLVVLIQGLATAARAGWGRERLSSVIDEVVSSLG